MSKPMLLAIVLVILIISSQFEWRDQLVSDVVTNTVDNQKQQQVTSKEEGVKDKIILSQEKNVQRLNELVRVLSQQLQECRAANVTTSNRTLGSSMENVIELEPQHILED